MIIICANIHILPPPQQKFIKVINKNALPAKNHQYEVVLFGMK
jgi:hypothetical protein